MGPVMGRGGLALVLALLVMGGIAVLVETQSPTRLYWCGERIDAVSQGGIVYYRWAGTQHTVPDGHRGAGDTDPVPVSVFVDPDRPTRALVDGPTRWIDAVLVGGWFVAAAAAVPFAVARQRRRLRRRAEFDAGSP